MGHKNPDMDAIGASMGVRKMVEKNKVKGYIVVNFNELNGSVSRLMDEIEKSPEIYENFISPEEALAKMTDKSLLVVVDTHKPSLVIDEKLLNDVKKLLLLIIIVEVKNLLQIQHLSIWNHMHPQRLSL